MNFEQRLEIHFYNQYQAAVSISGEQVTKENRIGLITLFNSFALRQMSNLGNIGTFAANVLSVVSSSPEAIESYLELIQYLRTPQDLAVHAPLLGVLGVDLSQVITYSTAPDIVMARVSSGHSTKSIANELWPDVVRIVDRRISDGSHQFLSDFKIEGDKAFLYLKPKGFGILGKAVNWYASTSIMVFYKYLLKEQSDDWEFQNSLARSANKCGEAFINGKVNSVSLITLPVSIARSAHKPAA